MLVVPDVLFWLGFGVLLLGAGELLRRAIRNVRRRRATAVLPGAGAASLVAAAVLVRLHTYDAVVLEDDGKGGLSAERMLTIGEPDHPSKWIYARHPTWIINRSTRSVYLELVWYGHEVVVDPSEIKPGSVGVDERVDYLGPDNPPPEHGTAGKTALWLRWDR